MFWSWLAYRLFLILEWWRPYRKTPPPDPEVVRSGRR